jgi:hypothetical protein
MGLTQEPVPPDKIELLSNDGLRLSMEKTAMARSRRFNLANDNRPREIRISGLSDDLPVTAAELELIEVFLTGVADLVTTGEAPAEAANGNDPRPDGSDENRT